LKTTRSVRSSIGWARKRTRVFFGRSAVCDPFGRLVCQAGDREELVVADVDLSQTAAAQAPLQYLTNRRPGLYGAIIQDTAIHSQ